MSDSYHQFITTDGFDFHKEIKIFFVGEVAQDAGGLMREWITELTKSIFNDQTGLFKLCRGQNDTSYFLNSKAKNIFSDFEHLSYFRFAGSILGKAIFEKIPIIAKLNKILLRNIVGNLQISLSDLKDYDLSLYKSVSYLSLDPSLTDEIL